MVNCELCTQEKPHTWDHVGECHMPREIHNQGLIESEFFGKWVVRVKMEVDQVGKQAIYV